MEKSDYDFYKADKSEFLFCNFSKLTKIIILLKRLIFNHLTDNCNNVSLVP